MKTDIFSILRGQQLTSGQPFPGLTNAAPLPEKNGNDLMRLRRQL